MEAVSEQKTTTTTEVTGSIYVQYIETPDPIQTGMVLLKGNQTTGKKHTFDVDYVFVVDTSGSMDGEKMKLVRATLDSVCDLSTVGSTLTIVGFSDRETVYTNHQPVKTCYNMISTLHPHGMTNIQAGLDKGVFILNTIPITKKRRRAFFAFTDGHINKGIQDGTDLQTHFKGIWEKHKHNTLLWLTSLGSDSDFKTIQYLSHVSQSSMFDHVRDSDYGQFPRNVGKMMGICQFAHFGTIEVCDRTIPFCLPQDGSNSFLFDISEYGTIVAKVCFSDGNNNDFLLSCECKQNNDNKRVNGCMSSLISVLKWKRECLAHTMYVINSPLSNLETQQAFLKHLQNQISTLDNQSDNIHYNWEVGLLEVAMNQLKSALNYVNSDIEDLHAVSSEVLYLQRQLTSEQNDSLGTLCRERSIQDCLDWEPPLEQLSPISPMSPLSLDS